MQSKKAMECVQQRHKNDVHSPNSLFDIEVSVCVPLDTDILSTRLCMWDKLISLVMHCPGWVHMHTPHNTHQKKTRLWTPTLVVIPFILHEQRLCCSIAPFFSFFFYANWKRAPNCFQLTPRTGFCVGLFSFFCLV